MNTKVYLVCRVGLASRHVYGAYPNRRSANAAMKHAADREGDGYHNFEILSLNMGQHCPEKYWSEAGYYWPVVGKLGDLMC